MSIYTNSQIPDPGQILVRASLEVAGEQAAEAVASEVQQMRRPDGSLVFADVTGRKQGKHSPLNGLNGLLSFEEISLTVWAESGFGMLQRRSAMRDVKRIWRTDGLGAAVNWVLENARRRPNIASLHDLLAQNATNPMGHLETAFRSNLAKDIRKWQR